MCEREYVCVCVCGVCVCMCVCEYVCGVCVSVSMCVCVCERERESQSANRTCRQHLSQKSKLTAFSIVTVFVFVSRRVECVGTTGQRSPGSLLSLAGSVRRIVLGQRHCESLTHFDTAGMGYQPNCQGSCFLGLA